MNKLIAQVVALVKKEPAIVISVMGAAITLLATSMGLHLSADQTKAVYSAVVAVVGLIVRSQVVPKTAIPPCPVCTVPAEKAKP